MDPRTEVLERLMDELEASIKTRDPILAEYILELYKKDPVKFRAELCDFPREFVDNVSLICAGRGQAQILRREQLHEGFILSVKVKKVVKFGAFATLLGVVPHTDALIHKSDNEGRDLGPGSQVKARISKMAGSRINLSLDLQGVESRHLVPPGVYKENSDEVLRRSNENVEEDIEIETSLTLPSFLRESGLEKEPVDSLQGEALDSGEMKVNEFVEEREAQGGHYGAWPVAKPRSITDTNLPVTGFKDIILSAVRESSFVVIVGDTGSGKSTQIPQFLLDHGFLVACTQPRRVAAISIAKRVSMERGTCLGDEVGYAVRFEENLSHKTKLRFVTDGLLQREAMDDQSFSKYSMIMLDEAHERTVATDILFSLLKRAALKRPELRVIVTSATLDAGKFSAFFENAPVIQIPGRRYPVDIKFSLNPEIDYFSAMLKAVTQIHMEEAPGDILVFLTGKEEIEAAASALERRLKLYPKAPSLLIRTIYAVMPAEQQAKIFDVAPPGERKVVLATNIAETSLTIDGIRYVIDPGFAKINSWSASGGFYSLLLGRISRSQADQRAGRAGRTGPGKCLRLYTKKAYEEEMKAQPTPEIQRNNLANTVLLLKAMGVDDVLNFEFMDPPPRAAVISSLQDMYNIGALDDSGNLTEQGKKMVQYPMDPVLAKTLILSSKEGCAAEMLTFMAMLEVSTTLMKSPTDKRGRDEARRAHIRLQDHRGDHLTFIKIYNSWIAARRGSKKWCTENFIDERSLKRARDTRNQLASIMTRQGEPITQSSDGDLILRVLTAGFFQNTARLVAGDYHQLFGGQNDSSIFIHPQSVLANRHPLPEYVLYHSIVLTSREFMHIVSGIKPMWLVKAAPTIFKVASEASKRKNNSLESLQLSKKRRPQATGIELRKFGS